MLEYKACPTVHLYTIRYKWECENEQRSRKKIKFHILRQYANIMSWKIFKCLLGRDGEYILQMTAIIKNLMKLLCRPIKLERNFREISVSSHYHFQKYCSLIKKYIYFIHQLPTTINQSNSGPKLILANGAL